MIFLLTQNGANETDHGRNSTKVALEDITTSYIGLPPCVLMISLLTKNGADELDRR